MYLVIFYKNEIVVKWSTYSLMNLMPMVQVSSPCSLKAGFLFKSATTLVPHRKADEM